MTLQGAVDELRSNPEQWRAYESRGNCVVLAGPGSGKTKLLTVKLARMLSEDVRPPRGIACITYSNECVGEIRDRLRGFGIREHRWLFVGTVHSFCLSKIVGPFAALAGEHAGRVATNAERGAALEAALQVLPFQARPRDYDLRVSVLRQTVLDRTGAAWRDDEQLADVTEAYEEELRLRGLLDFDSIVLTALRMVRSQPWLRRVLAARFPVIAIDEYQDLGVPLDALVQELAEAGIRVFAVGDPDQSIYGFQGARPELLATLAGRLRAEEITLGLNYRSGQTIIDGSVHVLDEPRNYRAAGDSAATIDFWKCPGGLDEQIERAIGLTAALRGQNVPLNEIAILYRTAAIGERIAAKASGQGLELTRIDGQAPVKRTPPIPWMQACADWCSTEWGASRRTLADLINEWAAFTSNEKRAVGGRLVSFLKEHRNADIALADWIDDFWSILQDGARSSGVPDETVDVLSELRAASHDGQLREWTVGAFGGLLTRRNRLSLMTLHSSKGLEFDVVMIVGLDDGDFPFFAASPTEVHESRRLFYVGMTRARRALHCFYSGFTVDRYGGAHVNGPSRFLVTLAEQMEVAL